MEKNQSLAEKSTLTKIIYARIAVLVGIIIGLIFTVFFNATDLGIAQPIFLLIVIISSLLPVLLVEKAKAGERFKRGILLLPVILLISLAFLYRLDITAVAFMTVFMPFVYYFAIASAFIRGVFAKFTIMGIFWIPFALLINWFGDMISLFRNLSLKVKVHSKGTQLLKRIMKGFLIAIPFVIVLFVLLGSADPIFGKFIQDIIDHIFVPLFHTGVERFISNLFMFISSFLFFSTFFFSLWNKESGLHKFYTNSGGASMSQLDSDKSKSVENNSTDKVVKSTEKVTKKWDFLSTSSFLGVINVVFIVFVLIQFKYLFGGEQNISGNYGYTYADYARRGFFELVAVSTIVYMMCVMLSAKVFLANTVQKIIFRGMYLIMVVATVFISVSAIMRMSLYIETYGYTSSRILVLLLTVLILILVLSLAIILFLESRRKFVRRSVAIGMIFIIMSVFIMPVDYVVAKLNYNNYLQNGKFDYTYHLELSDEVIPVLVDLAKDEKMSPEVRFVINQHLETKKDSIMKSRNSWQSYNLFDQHNKYLLNSFESITDETSAEMTDAVKKLVNDYGALLTAGKFETAFRDYWKRDTGSYDYDVEEDYTVTKYEFESVKIFVDQEYRNPRFLSGSGVSVDRYRNTDYMLDLKLVSIMKAEVKVDAYFVREGYYSDRTFTSDRLTLEYLNGKWQVAESTNLNLRAFWIP